MFHELMLMLKLKRAIITMTSSGHVKNSWSDFLFLQAPPPVTTDGRASVTMTDNKRLAFSILRFLHDQLQSGNLSSGAQESLEGESTRTRTTRTRTTRT